MISNVMRIIMTGINACWDWICSLWSAVGLSFPTVSIVVLTSSLFIRYFFTSIVGAGAQLPRVDVGSNKAPVDYDEKRRDKEISDAYRWMGGGF